MSEHRTNKPEWRFYLSCDVDLQVRVKVNSLHGVLPYVQQAQDQLGHFHPTAAFVVATLSAGGDVLGLQTQTTYTDTLQEGAMWAEWLTFCVKYRDLPCDTFLSLSVYELSEGHPLLLVGSTAMPLFSKKGRLKTGQQRLQVWEGCPVDVQQPERLLGKPPLHQRSQVGHLEHLVKLYSRGDIPHCDWLDMLTLKEIQQLRAAELHEAVSQGVMLLTLELPVFPHAVLYQQSLSAAAVVAAAAGAPSAGASAAAAGSSAAAAAAAGPGGPAAGVADVIRFQDPEVGLDNPAELKAAKLARSVTRGLIDKDLKPNSDERRRINAVLQLPPNKPLSQEAKALLWRFRYALVKEKRALTKFLKCVDWSDAQEAQQAADLMKEWAAIDIADALELLSPDFKNHEVRAHAVATLQRKEDDELLYYLLQLVQALRFEAADNSRLARFLVHRATHNPAFATFLHWYLFTEFEDPEFGGRASAVHGAMLGALDGAGPPGKAVCNAIRKQTEVLSQLAYISKELKMSRLKAARATERMREMVGENGPCSELSTCLVPLPLKPEVLLEGLLPQECTCFRSAQLPMKLVFRTSLRAIDWTSPNPLAPTAAAAAGAAAWVAPPPASSSPTPPPAAVAAATARHQQQQQQQQQQSTAAGGHSLPQQQQQQQEAGPDQQQQDWLEQLATPQQQQQQPLPRVTAAYGRCVVIYKKGDDLRQDQFILQMISLMDNLLKRENLDLRLTPYRVLPTGSDDGLVEFVPSAPLSRILAEHRTIHKFLAQTQADPTGPFGLKPEVLESFVRSCAGYCVMTYILGVGDRHLDNLMLVPDGRLFHIDFGYILGNDPKPFPPPMKLCREMIEAMGGQDSKYYAQFRLYCCEAYEILRKSSDLILSLFHLMAGASIEAIRNNPENAMLKLQEKLCLDLDDAQARDRMQQLINESATALMPQIVETTHRWAQYWR